MKAMEKVQAGLVGLCVGDALGVPVEFRERHELERQPVRGMQSGGTHGQPAGTWSDDSSLTFCLAESLVEGFDLRDLAGRMVRWLDQGYWTARGTVFDVGGATRAAITRLRQGVAPAEAGLEDERSNGNGSLMRILPLVFYVDRYLGAEPVWSRLEIAHEVSCLTHGHLRSQMACGFYVELAFHLLGGSGPREALERMREAVRPYYSRSPYREELAHFARVLEGDLAALPEEEIRSGGYVVETLEAALWCLLNGRTYPQTVLRAVNLGGDTDTTAAVCGGLAGLVYGLEAIPEQWVKRLARRREIEDLAARLAASLHAG